MLFMSGANKLNEICLLETMEARCRWNSEVIVMTSARWGRMKTGRCLNIHPNLLASVSNDPMFLGCSEDVLSILDMKCSSKPACDVVVPNPDLDTITPCYEDLTRYLEASYTCVKGNSDISLRSHHFISSTRFSLRLATLLSIYIFTVHVDEVDIKKVHRESAKRSQSSRF